VLLTDTCWHVMQDINRLFPGDEQDFTTDQGMAAIDAKMPYLLSLSNLVATDAEKAAASALAKAFTGLTFPLLMVCGRTSEPCLPCCSPCQLAFVRGVLEGDSLLVTHSLLHMEGRDTVLDIIKGRPCGASLFSLKQWTLQRLLIVQLCPTPLSRSYAAYRCSSACLLLPCHVST
jgi:hypothetical protein